MKCKLYTDKYQYIIGKSNIGGISGELLGSTLDNSEFSGNIIGTDNVLTAAIEEGVEAVICLSTDKAAYPINAMGKSKSLEESVAIAKSRYSGKTKICCTRYGNVMCSRGSVIPLWIDQIKAGNPITVTEPNMTRFIMSLEEAVDLVLYAFEHGENGDLLIMKAPACKIGLQAEAV